MFSTSKVAILAVSVVLLACKFPTVYGLALSWPASFWSWAIRAGLAISLLSLKQVHHMDTMVAGVGLTWKSQSTNLLRDTLDDRAEYVDSFGVSNLVCA